MKVGKPIISDGFENVSFKALRGYNHEVHELSLADIPFMNPDGWISLINIVAKNTAKYKHIYQFMKKIIRAYILEVAKMNIEIAAVLKRKPIMNPFPPPDNLDKFKVGFIEKELWGVAYKSKENKKNGKIHVILTI